MRLVPWFGALAVGAVLLAACGGGGSDSSPTPEAPTPTPEPAPCTSTQLHAALVSADELGGSPLLTLGLSNTGANCTLDGPPALNWYDGAGELISVPAATNVPCQPQAGDYSTCVFEGEVLLPGEGATPSAEATGQAVAIVGVRADPSCDQVTAAALGLQFTGLVEDARVQLEAPITVPACEGAVTLYGYGPLPTPQE